MANQINKSSVYQSKLFVRKVEKIEVSEMVALTLNSYREYKANLSREFWQAYSRDIKTAIENAAESNRIAAFMQNQMVGSVLYCDRNQRDQLPEIRLLAVKPKKRRYGIGKLLMNACESRAIESGIGSVILHTTAIMSIARSMYERSGYVRSYEYDFCPAPGFLVMGYRKEFYSEAHPPTAVICSSNPNSAVIEERLATPPCGNERII